MARSRNPKATEEEMGEMMEEILHRLARDPKAEHLWQFRARPGCEDEPPGKSRRSHLGTLLGLVGTAAIPGAVATCHRTCGDDPCDCGDDPCGCGDDPCAADGGTDGDADADVCGDDPCGCADDPCSCGDDPCDSDAGPDGSMDGGPDADGGADADADVCGDDPCACGDDPCDCADDPC